MFDSSLEYFFNIWQEEEKNTDKIKTLVDGQDFVMFFKKGNNVYGAGEDSRLTFARMKSKPDEETTKDWIKEANFIGINLSKAITGDKVHNIFSKKDLSEIKIIDKNEAQELLEKQVKGEKLNPPTPKKHKDPEQTVGTIQLKDKK